MTAKEIISSPRNNFFSTADGGKKYCVEEGKEIVIYQLLDSGVDTNCCSKYSVVK
jgi:hypothetical protein